MQKDIYKMNIKLHQLLELGKYYEETERVLLDSY